MVIAALLAGLLLWLTFGGKAMRDRRNWPALAAMLIGLVLIAKGHAVEGALLMTGGAAWLRRPWRLRRDPAEARPFAQDMALADAYALLGLPPDADRSAIVAAHRRLIARNHPDQGGTQALAARLNAARDLLLAAHDVRP